MVAAAKLRAKFIAIAGSSWRRHGLEEHHARARVHLSVALLPAAEVALGCPCKSLLACTRVRVVVTVKVLYVAGDICSSR